MSENEDKTGQQQTESQGVFVSKAANPAALNSPTRTTSIFRRMKSVDQTKLQEPAAAAKARVASHHDRD